MEQFFSNWAETFSQNEYQYAKVMPFEQIPFEQPNLSLPSSINILRDRRMATTCMRHKLPSKCPCKFSHKNMKVTFIHNVRRILFLCFGSTGLTHALTSLWFVLS